MKNKTLPYRQIHLDFHTSPVIPGIGNQFSRKNFQEALRAGHVNSITCFSSCHHGWSYHPTEIAAMHPNLEFNLLREQIDACREIGVQTPVYMTAGVDNRAAERHPEWREIAPDGTLAGWTSSPLDPGFKTLCFNSPYLDFLCARIEETALLFPEADGFFLDIIMQQPCCCPHCMKVMEEKGWNPELKGDRLKCSQIALETYYERATASCKVSNPDMPVFHNSGNIPMGRRSVFKWFSHQELESLPTGGWGYDHFPMTAKYSAGLGQEFLGMTGKFHTTWGEFGGFKSPDALRYECASMMAFGAKCSIGDQLHPSGKMDASTYRIIGEAYKDVEEKEPWCLGSRNLADIGLLSCVANRERVTGLWDPTNRDSPGDIGASRILLESHFLFDVLDDRSDFSPYKAIILPDFITVDSFLKQKLDAYVKKGGKLLFSGESGLDEEGNALFDFGGAVGPLSEFQPDYILPKGDYSADLVDSPIVMYEKSRRLTVTDGESLGDVYDPYFNRTYDHFCSHQHAPNSPFPSGYSCAVVKGSILYLPHRFFTLYRAYGAVVHKAFLEKCLDRLLGNGRRIETNLPSSARIVFNRQESESRSIVHLLYGNTVTRGGAMNLVGGVGGDGRVPRFVEMIDTLLPLVDTEVKIKTPKPSAVYLEPQHKRVDFSWHHGVLELRVHRFICHQMIVLHD